MTSSLFPPKPFTCHRLILTLHDRSNPGYSQVMLFATERMVRSPQELYFVRRNCVCYEFCSKLWLFHRRKVLAVGRDSGAYLQCITSNTYISHAVRWKQPTGSYVNFYDSLNCMGTRVSLLESPLTSIYETCSTTKYEILHVIQGYHCI